MIGSVLDTDQLGQAAIGLCVFLGFVAQQYQARKRAEGVKQKTDTAAAEVATAAVDAATELALQVEAARTEQLKALAEIKVIVNGRLDALLAELQAERTHNANLEARLRETDKPGPAE